MGRKTHLIGELLQDRGLSCVVEAEHEKSRLVVVLLQFAEEIQKSHISFFDQLLNDYSKVT